MSSLPKLSFFLLALGFLAAPFFIFAADTDVGKPGGSLQTFFRVFDGFSLKNLDSRIYARLEGQGGEITQTAEAGGDFYGNCWWYNPIEGCPQCDDNSDNDNDGKKDFPSDPGCTDYSDTNEWGTLQCDNGADDDGDGTGDVGGTAWSWSWWSWFGLPADPGCSSPSDTSEYGNKQCDDNIDNDGVNGKDFKAGGSWGTGDPNCESPSDNSESAAVIRGRPPVVEVPQQALNPSVDLYFDNNPGVDSITVPGNAYETKTSIYWNVVDSCSTQCTSSPSNWWNGTLSGSPEGGSGTGHVDNISILSAGATTYTLTCGKLPCSSHVTNADSVTGTPQWSPSFSFSGPAQVNTNERVNLIWSGNDIKSCPASGGWSGPGTSALQVSNTLQNQDHSVDVGTISADKTFYLTCTGYNDVVLSQKMWPVDLATSPTPFFSINSINLIIIGPGSGGRSNKAIVGVTKSASFTGNIILTATPALGSESLTSQGAELCLNATDGTTCSSSAAILCTSSLSSTCDNTAEFWVETASNLNPIDYTVTLTADPQPPSTLASETKTIPLRVRRFIPAFEEI